MTLKTRSRLPISKLISRLMVIKQYTRFEDPDLIFLAKLPHGNQLVQWMHRQRSNKSWYMKQKIFSQSELWPWNDLCDLENKIKDNSHLGGLCTNVVHMHTTSFQVTYFSRYQAKIHFHKSYYRDLKNEVKVISQNLCTGIPNLVGLGQISLKILCTNHFH